MAVMEDLLMGVMVEIGATAEGSEVTEQIRRFKSLIN